MVEIFLFPVRVRGGNRLHPSTKRLAATATRQPWQHTLLRTLQQHGQLAQQAASKLDPSERTAIREAGERRQACVAQSALLTSFSESSEKELAPRSSPSWPGAPGCHVSERERNVKGRHGTDSSHSTSSPGCFPVQNPLLGNTSVESTRLQ